MLVSVMVLGLNMTCNFFMVLEIFPLKKCCFDGDYRS